MSRLLRANFTCLWKSFIFRLCMISSAGLGVLLTLIQYADIKKNAEIYAQLDESFQTADDLIFSGGIYILFIAAIFVGVFVGTEYSDGTIRNKIITGHSRCRIYLANTLVCTLATVLMNLSFILATLVMGDTILTPSHFSTREILLCSLSSTAAMAAATTVYLLFAMLIQSKAIASVCALMTALVLLFTSFAVRDMLGMPEYYYMIHESDESDEIQESDESDEIPDENDEIQKSGKRYKNPRYPTDMKREIYKFLDDFLPSGQMLQLLENNLKNPRKAAACSLFILVTGTGAGILIFRRKNIK